MQRELQKYLKAAIVATVVVALAFGLASLPGPGQVDASDASPRGIGIGSSWMVNTYTTGFQRVSRIGLTSDGTFTVGWQSFDNYGGSTQDGSGSGVYMQRYDWNLAALGIETRVNQTTDFDQIITEVVQRRLGSTIHLGVTFESFQGSGFGSGINSHLRLYTNGNPDSPDDLVANMTTAGNQNGPNLFFTDNGVQLHGGVVFEGQTANATDVLYRVGVYSGGGPYSNLQLGGGAGGGRQIAGEEFQINTYVTGYQGRPSACGTENGDFVVVWTSFGQDASNSTIIGRRANVGTGPVGTEFVVNTNTTAAQDYPHVCCSNSGFVVTWRNNDYPVAVDGDSTSLSARRFAPDATALGTEFLVHETTTGGQYGGRVSCDPAGNFMVVWQNVVGFVTQGVYTRAFDANGDPLTSETLMDAEGIDGDVSMTSNGRAVATWARNAPGGGSSNVFAQQLSVPGIGGGTTTTIGPTTTTTMSSGGGVCGDPVDPPPPGLVAGARAISATDALFVLQAAVSAVACDDCVCDVNGQGGTTATDALIVLQVAVGQQIALQCPACT